MHPWILLDPETQSGHSGPHVSEGSDSHWRKSAGPQKGSLQSPDPGLPEPSALVGLQPEKENHIRSLKQKEFKQGTGSKGNRIAETPKGDLRHKPQAAATAD